MVRKAVISVTNSITVTIEPDFNGAFSVLAFDEMGDIWIEKFEPTICKANKTADKLFKKLTDESNTEI